MFRRKKQWISPEEYLAIEENAEFKSEYWDGFVEKRPDSDIMHVRFVTNLANLLFTELKERDCQVYATELKVWAEKQKCFLYPDIIAVCNDIELYPNRQDVIINPILIVEYSSINTRNTDRTDKLWAYLTIKSLQEYVLITYTGGQNDVIEQYLKQNDNSWKYTISYSDKDFIFFESLNVKLSSKEIFWVS